MYHMNETQLYLGEGIKGLYYEGRAKKIYGFALTPAHTLTPQKSVRDQNYILLEMYWLCKPWP